MSTPTPVDVPGDVVDWVTDIFRQCNIRISACLLTMRNFAADIKPVAKSFLSPSSSVQAAFLSAG
jgi:hypothetical protein